MEKMTRSCNRKGMGRVLGVIIDRVWVGYYSIRLHISSLKKLHTRVYTRIDTNSCTHILWVPNSYRFICIFFYLKLDQL